MPRLPLCVQKPFNVNAVRAGQAPLVQSGYQMGGKNPFVEGSYTGEDFEDVKRKWEAKKLYFLDYKKDCTLPPCIDLAMALHGFGIDNIAAQNAMAGSKALHAR